MNIRGSNGFHPRIRRGWREALYPCHPYLAAPRLDYSAPHNPLFTSSFPLDFKRLYFNWSVLFLFKKYVLIFIIIILIFGWYKLTNGKRRFIKLIENVVGPVFIYLFILYSYKPILKVYKADIMLNNILHKYIPGVPRYI